jgi:hypothetical protein
MIPASNSPTMAGCLRRSAISARSFARTENYDEIEKHGGTLGAAGNQ